MPFQRPRADFRALQILQDADGASFAGGGSAQALNVVRMILVRAMREVQASDIHAEAEQVAHGRFGMAGRADGTDDFGAARGGGRNTFGSGVLCCFQICPQIQREY